MIPEVLLHTAAAAAAALPSNFLERGWFPSRWRLTPDEWPFPPYLTVRQQLRDLKRKSATTFSSKK